MDQYRDHSRSDVEREAVQPMTLPSFQVNINRAPIPAWRGAGVDVAFWVDSGAPSVL